MPEGKFKIERRVTCGCCAGSGQYIPLVGPPEPCDTCKGEKTVVVEEVEGTRAGEVVVNIGPIVESKLNALIAEKQAALRKIQEGYRVWRMRSQDPVRGEAANAVIVDEVCEDRGWPYSACHSELVALHDAGKLSVGMLILASELPHHLQLEHKDRLLMANLLLDNVRGAVKKWKKNERFAAAYGGTLVGKGPNAQNIARGGMIPESADTVPAMIQPNERAVAYNFQLQMENARSPVMDAIMAKFYDAELGVPHKPTPDLEFTGRMDV